MLTKIVNALTAKQELGGPMVCSYLLGFPDHYKSHRFKVVYWRSYVKDACSIDDLAANPSSDLADDPDKVALGHARGQVIEIRKVNDYVYRPESYRWHSLYQFLVSTDIRATKSNVSASGAPFSDVSDDSDDNDDHDESGTQHRERSAPYERFLPAHPQYADRAVFPVRTERHYILNFVGGSMPRPDRGDHEFYCATMLTLFVPWRTGSDLKQGFATWTEAFAFWQPRLDLLALSIIKNFNALHECRDERDRFS
ncbi:hypothetical protein OBBRIDRAFT_732172, partial [Obba rivulosa]